MDELEHILREYAAFEFEVEAFSSELWFQWCSNCREVCCKAVYCRETLESPFLFLLSKNHSPDAYYSPQKAWLNEAGCKLSVGRPPVCYEFLCGAILDAQQPGLQRYAMMVLSKLTGAGISAESGIPTFRSITGKTKRCRRHRSQSGKNVCHGRLLHRGKSC